MGVMENHAVEIAAKTYGKDLREPIHDAIELLTIADRSPRPVILLSKEEYEAIETPDDEIFYAIKLTGGNSH